MKDSIEYERPNTVSGLSAKRKELVKLLGKITADAERVRANIKNIDACIKLFDPNATPPNNLPRRVYTAPHSAQGALEALYPDNATGSF